MEILKALFRITTLFCTVFIILTGTKQLSYILESCSDKFIHSEMSFENFPEDDLEEDDIELKDLFLGQTSICSPILEQVLSLSFAKSHVMVHGDFSLDFFPPPDLM